MRSVDNLLEEISDRGVRVGVLLVLLLLPLGLYRYLAFDLVSYPLLFGALLLPLLWHMPRHPVRLSLIYALIGLAAIGSAVNFGAAMGMVWILVLATTVTLFSGRWAGFFALGSGLVICQFAAVLSGAPLAVVGPASGARPLGLLGLSQMIMVGSTGAVLVWLLGLLVLQLRKAVGRLAARAEGLDEQQTRLEKRIARRTRQLKRADEQLVASTEAHRQLVESLPAGVLVEDWSRVKPELEALRVATDRPLAELINEDPERFAALVSHIRPVYANRRMLELFGAADLQALSNHFATIDAATHELMNYPDRMLDGVRQIRYRSDEQTLDGRTLAVDWQMSIPDHAAGDWSRIHWVADEIGDHLQAEEQMRVTLEVMQQGVALIDETWHVRLFNRRAREIFGLSEDRFPPGTPFEEVLRETARTGLRGHEHLDRRLTELRDGQEHCDVVRVGALDVEFHTLPLRLGGALVVYTDVTRRERGRRILLRDLEQTNRRHALLLEATHSPVVLLGTSREVLEANQAARELVDDGRTLTFDALLHAASRKDCRARLEQMVDETLQGRSVVAQEARLDCAKHPGTRSILFSASPLTAEDTAVVEGVVLVGQDVTEMRAAELQLIHASRLATVGEMGTSMAHEIRQPLNVIRLAVGNLGRAIGKLESSVDEHDRERINGRLDRMRGQIDRADKIIRHMLDFGRRPSDETVMIDPVDVFEAAIEMAGEQLRMADIQLRRRLTRGAQVQVNVVKLEQVLLNLIANARQAIVHGDAPRRWIEVGCETDGSDVLLSVSDSGGGIPEAVLESIFDAFFTTKSAGVGTGLGLAISRRLVEEAGGTMGAGNGPEGAMFAVTLPLAA